MNRNLLRAMTLTWAIVATSSAQQPGGNVPTRAQSRQRIARQKWQSAGRRIPGANSAMLRSLAIRQKTQMRAARMRSPNPGISGAGVSGAWISLGPLPLPSDASGIGLHDYGWVSGRATAVAIDPNDTSGNTVYAGGAYAGVWKSVNAGSQNPNPALVTWSARTDDQPTLAIGALAIQPQLLNPDQTKAWYWRERARPTAPPIPTMA